MVKHSDIIDLIRRIIQISSSDDTTSLEKLQEIIVFLSEITETSKGSIMLKRDKLNMEVIASTSPDLIGVKQPLNGDSPSCWVFKHKVPLYIDKEVRFSGSFNSNTQYDKVAFFVIPIIRKKEVLGVINLTEKKGDDVFSDEEKAVMLDLAGIIISQIETFKLAEELEAHQSVLEEKNQKLKKLEKIRSDFFQMMVHDLKGPVSEVISNLDMLSYMMKPENQEYVKAALTGCDNMYRMISNLLDITRMEDGTLGLVSEKISALDLIKEAASRLFATAKNENIELELLFPDETEPPFIWGDRGVLLRVFQNLIMNAILHSKTKDKIFIGYGLKENRVIFNVKDCGKGIDPKIHHLIFDKYYHTKERASSTGLGLAFCKMAVESHKGKIWVESNGKKGTDFYLSFEKLKDIEEDTDFDFRS